jgi:riboflavin synthase
MYNIAMFKGIIEKKSHIRSTKKRPTGIDVHIEKPKGWKFTLGESVAVNGICSTVTSQTLTSFTVHYMPETLEHSTAGLFAKKHVVNLERSLRFGDRVHGHLVQGHVSSVGSVAVVTRKGGRWDIEVHISRDEQKYIIPKGSVTIDGVSLTIARKTKQGCVVSIITHTLKETTVGELKEGSHVNIETDFLVRAYLQKP